MGRRSFTASAPSPFALSGKRLVLLNGMALILWFAGTAGMLQPLNGTVYDTFMRLRARYNPSPAEVLLLVIDDRDAADRSAFLGPLLDMIERSGASLVVFNYTPALPPDDPFFREIRTRGRVIFGQWATPSRRTDGRYEARAGPDVPAGIVCLPPYEDGIYRSQHAAVPTDESIQIVG